MLELQDSIGGLASYTSSKYPSINNEFCTTTLNNIYEEGMDVKDALKQSQETLENEFGDKAEDAETLAGLILDIKEDFPKIKEQIDYGRCQFIVLELDKRRIGKVKVIINSSSEE